MVNHGLISDKDGEIAKCMLELGHIETYLSRIASNSNDYSDLPFDEGSIFTRLLYNPDEIDLDSLDKHIFKVKNKNKIYESNLFFNLENIISIESSAFKTKIFNSCTSQ